MRRQEVGGRVHGVGSGLMRGVRLTCKRNGPYNLWGSFGDTNAIPRKYWVDSAELPAAKRGSHTIGTA